MFTSSKPATKASPEKQGMALPHLGRALTDVQELKQVPWIARLATCVFEGQPSWETITPGLTVNINSMCWQLLSFGHPTSPLCQLLTCHSPALSNPGQVAGGVDIIKKTIQAFCVPSSKVSMLVDMHAYDSFPALCALEAILWGHNIIQ